MTNSTRFVLMLVLTAACGASSTPPASSPSEAPSSQGGATAERAELTPAQCEAQGGTVVGDIGDGAIHRPDYRCEGSGEAPVGSVVQESGQAMAIEGAVCCK